MPEITTPLYRSRIIFAATVLVISIWFVACGGSKQSDAELRQKLVGTWVPDAVLGRTLTGELNYRTNSTFDGFITIRRQDLNLNGRFAGTWRIEGSKLTLRYTRSDVPRLIAAGRVTVDRILSITEKELVFVSEEGQRETRRRK
ncbi:MAG: lipocalin family protein [Verrucomicrobiota bacterium]